MNKEVISEKQSIFLMILLLSGSSSLFIVGIKAKQDFWLAIILAVFMEMIIVLILARLHYIFPGKNLFDMIETCFGKLFGRIIILLYICYTFEYMSRLLYYFSKFITTVGFPETPQVIISISVTVLCIWVVKDGVEGIGRLSTVALPAIIVIIFITIVLLIPEMNIDNLSPILSNGIKPVLTGAFGAFAFPLSEVIVFTMISSYFKTRKSPYKIYILGLLISGIILMLTSLTNILVLGVKFGSTIYFPSYATVSKISIGDFLRRMEVISSTVFIMGTFFKASILLLATCKGITKIFICKDYRFIIIPISLLAINLSYFEFENVMDAKEFYAEIVPFYTMPFKIILPIIIFIIAERHKKKSVYN